MQRSMEPGKAGEQFMDDSDFELYYNDPEFEQILNAVY